VRKIVKWFLLFMGGLLGIVVIALAAMHVNIGQRLDTVHDIPAEALEVPADEASLEEGKRLARLRGCMGGCHGSETGGSVFFEVPDGSRIVAPDLGKIAAQYSAPELARLMRHGVRADGTGVLGIMPSSMLYGLSDGDTAKIIAFLQSRMPGDEAVPESVYGPLLRAMLFYYSWQFDWSIIPAESIDHDAPRIDPASDDTIERGRYLATTVCTECHGDDLRGTPDGSTPSLAVAVAYSREDFANLMKTGSPIGGRELGLMKEVALGRFSYFTASEVDDLHTYLQTLVASTQD
jgi:mono/diheme cytochrome c family protein